MPRQAFNFIYPPLTSISYPSNIIQTIPIQNYLDFHEKKRQHKEKKKSPKLLLKNPKWESKART